VGAVDFFAVDFLAVDFLAVDFFAVDFFAVGADWAGSQVATAGRTASVTTSRTSRTNAVC
jgi:hypothetical protein